MGAALRAVEHRGRRARVLQQRLGSVRRQERVVAEAAAVVIRPGTPDEGARLKDIAIASKGHWGYPPERVREWAERGDFGRETFEQLALFVADTGERAVAWASVESRGDVAWLADLWVEPEWMGRGLGTRLF